MPMRFKQMRVALNSGHRQLLSSCKAPGTLGRANRWYATQNPARDGRPLAYTWLTKTGEEITPDDILSSLPSGPVSPSAASASVPLLLVTPNFAHWLDSSSPFLSQFLGRLYGNSPENDTLYAVTAVVDALPNTTSKSTNLSESEGLSLLVVGQSGVQAKAASPRLIRTSASEETNLLFSFQPKVIGQTSKGPAHEIGLRLANTIFVNGRETTIFGTRWLWDETSNGYTLNSSIDFTSCMITATSQAVNTALELPLHPVTERRRVMTSMGNILRQLAKSTDVTSTDTMPASSELERELPLYIAEHNIIDQRVSVWALVEKPDLEVTDPGSSTHDRLIQSLEQGGKLHRVMSGGGGWGKKQGLLSLDPEVGFSGTANKDDLITLSQVFDPDTIQLDRLPSIDKGITVDDLSLLSQVAAAGDYIQFFVSVEPTGAQGSVSRNNDLQEEPISYHFGMVADSMELETHATDEDSSKVISLPRTFGALSEKAIAYSQPIKGEMLSEEASMFAVDLQASGLSILPDRIQLSLPTSGVSISFQSSNYSTRTSSSRLPSKWQPNFDFDSPVYAPFFGALGCTSAIVFTCFGAAYGTAKAGVGVCSMAVLRPDLIVKNIVPIVMAGIIGIYGLVVSVLVANDLNQTLPLYTGFIQLGAGLSVGLAGLAAGFAIGIVGDAGVRGTAQQPRLYVGMILILIFAEVLGLYGLIVALLMNSRSKGVC
ncbi:hypothetical protein LT330_009709 [Penicillium expansum]|nr:hypothetical protein LT330_009709 [Penicillium expansum]